MKTLLTSIVSASVFGLFLAGMAQGQIKMSPRPKFTPAQATAPTAHVRQQPSGAIHNAAAKAVPSHSPAERQAAPISSQALPAASQPIPVGELDLRVGTFNGYWCGHAATFQIEWEDPKLWIYKGKILIIATGQLDPIWIEQRGDDSLHIIRYLSGPDAGKTQVAVTHPPQITVLKPSIGRTEAVFYRKSLVGPGTGFEFSANNPNPMQIRVPKKTRN